MKIGLVSLWWPPHYGGGEIYAYRLARALRDARIEVEVITTTPTMPDRDNGDVDVLRTGVFHEPRAMNAFRRYLQGPEHASWCDEVARWADVHRFTHVLCNSPLMRPGFSTATPALFARLKATGAIVGAIHLDLGPRTVSRVLSCYADCRDWEQTAATVRSEQRANALARGARAFYDGAASPLFYEPDFLLSCSHWSARLIDPLDQVPTFVLHPLLPATAAVEGTGEQLARVTVAMINPLPQKGAAHMAHVVGWNRRDWTFRVLQGAWGQAFESFAPAIAGPRTGKTCVSLLPYVREMSAFYRASDAFMFPSRFEGYGMAPVEAMQVGTPVIATDYPAILEAVGSPGAGNSPAGARIVSHLAAGDAWIDAIAEVLADRDRWRRCAVTRTHALREREAEEFPAFTAFLQSLLSARAR
jgi:glycosyltransferase involved in cell wall biosynthesis